MREMSSLRMHGCTHPHSTLPGGLDAERGTPLRIVVPQRVQPLALIDGRSATVEEAIQAAATFLHEADMPLVYGMSNTTCEAQKECAAMADQLGGLLDSHTSL